MNGIGRPPLPEGEVKSKVFTFRVKPHLGAAIEAMAKRENMANSVFVERAVLKALGLNQDAVSVWLAEGRQRKALEADEAARETFYEVST